MEWQVFQLALREIRRNLVRSALTMLGIVVGVAAVIALLGLGSGATAKVTRQITSLGTNLMIVMPGARRGHGPGGLMGSAQPFDPEDVRAVEQQVPGLAEVAPLSSQPGVAVFGNANWTTTILGADDAYLRARDWTLAQGRAFSPGELISGRAVCILGATVREKLFGGEEPVGTSIRIGNVSCKVIGLLEAKGQSAFGSDQDDLILLPLTTFQRRIAGNRDVRAIYLSLAAGASRQAVTHDVTVLLRSRRHLPKGTPDDFQVRDMQEILQFAQGTLRTLTALLGAVAAISLVVGGIGIMNVMLASVTERTREIGIRMAVGAFRRDVLMQFLVEAGMISALGGVGGILLGLALTAVAGAWMGLPFVFDASVIVVAFVFSAGVGVAFGYAPARRAARLDPIEALRHE